MKKPMHSYSKAAAQTREPGRFAFLVTESRNMIRQTGKMAHICFLRAIDIVHSFFTSDTLLVDSFLLLTHSWLI